MFIKEVWPTIIKNSRREKTIQVEVKTDKGKFIASAPSGKSIGKYETPAYSKRGIGWSLKLLKTLCVNFNNKNIVLNEFNDLEKIENYIKKFEENNEKIGANGTYALETALLKAGAKENGRELWQFVKDDFKAKMPIPIANCIGGGLHSHSKRKPNFQEFLVIPNENSFLKNVTKNIRVYFALKKLLKKTENKWKIEVDDESAWQTSLNEIDVLDILKKLDINIGIDVAASAFYDSQNQIYLYENILIKSREEQIMFIQRLINDYKLFYVEDPLDEEDFNSFAKLKKSLIVGDDLTTTNLKRIERAVEKKSINAVIIKPNQNGYLFDVSKIVKFCKDKKLKIILSHRSGETMDNALADFAVGFDADYVKAGISGKERLVKLQRLIEIEKSL